MSAPAKYQKKPVVIEAMQLPYDAPGQLAVLAWMLREGGRALHTGNPDAGLLIDTLEGSMRAAPGDYVIRGVKGEFYPCRADIFAATYIDAPTEEPRFHGYLHHADERLELLASGPETFVRTNAMEWIATHPQPSMTLLVIAHITDTIELDDTVGAGQ